MTDNPDTSAKPALTDEQLEFRKKTKELAKQQGLDWETLSSDERKKLKASVRKSMKAQR
jgi:hypothetical protein